jgi:hypothetical protein
MANPSSFYDCMPYKAHLVSFSLIILKFSEFSHKNATKHKESDETQLQHR